MAKQLNKETQKHLKKNPIIKYLLLMATNYKILVKSLLANMPTPMSKDDQKNFKALLHHEKLITDFEKLLEEKTNEKI